MSLAKVLEVSAGDVCSVHICAIDCWQSWHAPNCACQLAVCQIKALKAHHPAMQPVGRETSFDAAGHASQLNCCRNNCQKSLRLLKAYRRSVASRWINVILLL